MSQPPQHIIANSYKNFHAKGFHYLCLYRSPELTRKVYIAEDHVTEMPEVVNPHDHRYNFRTEVLAGSVTNLLYTTPPKDGFAQRRFTSAGVFQHFDYRTPLLGGNGFTWRGETELGVLSEHTYTPTRAYLMNEYELHTIRINQPGTVLLLDQYADVVADDAPTSTYFPDTNAPDLTDSGLYEKFTADEIVTLLGTITELTKGRI